MPSFSVKHMMSWNYFTIKCCVACCTLLKTTLLVIQRITPVNYFKNIFLFFTVYILFYHFRGILLSYSAVPKAFVSVSKINWSDRVQRKYLLVVCMVLLHAKQYTCCHYEFVCKMDNKVLVWLTEVIHYFPDAY